VLSARKSFCVTDPASAKPGNTNSITAKYNINLGFILMSSFDLDCAFGFNLVGELHDKKSYIEVMLIINFCPSI
jgi:hypothetical protein